MNNLVLVNQVTRAISNDPYSQEGESYEEYCLFYCQKSLNEIMQLHINREYSDSFGNIYNDSFCFPKDFNYENEYYLFSQILSTLENAVKHYFICASRMEKFNIDNINIQFDDIDDYLSEEEAISSCQNSFLNILPSKKK